MGFGTSSDSFRERLATGEWYRSRRFYRKLIFLGTLIIISWLYPIGERLEYRFDVGEVALESIIAPFTFSVLKSEAVLERERDLARSSIPHLFRRSPEIAQAQINNINVFFNRADDIHEAEEVLVRSRDRLYKYQYEVRGIAAQQDVSEDSTTLANLRNDIALQFPLDLSSDHWSEFFKGETADGRRINFGRIQRSVQTITRDILSQGVMDIGKEQIDAETLIAVSAEGVESIFELRFLMDQDEAWARARTMMQAQYDSAVTVESSVLSDLLIFFVRPNLAFDAEATQRREEDAVSQVPIYKAVVLENVRIVDANTVVTEDILEKLNSLTAAKSLQIASAGGILLWLPRIGMVMIVAILLGIFYSWVSVFRSKWYRQNRLLLLMSIVFVLNVFMTHLFHYRFGLNEYIVPLTVGAMAFTILFDARTAIVANFVSVIMAGFLVGGRIDFVLVSLAAGIVAIYSVRQLRRRSQIFTAIIYIVSIYVITIVAIEFLKFSSLAVLGNHLMYATINGVLAPIMVYGLIGALEMSFDLTTNLTLLELSDFNHPLLRRLSREANGTFSHSIVVGNLAEAAANAIGANSLLCRVGAYYHDIGKLARPEYFIENQFRQSNPHDSIAAHLSAKVVKNHVKEGLKLAKEYGLPSAIANFIPMHHGTARIEYFYHKSVTENGGEQYVKEDDFRYTGPKPDTKETGILMLVEAIEAATRSLKKPTLYKIQQMVDSIIEIRRADGQLDECPLTLKDLKDIQGNAREGTGILSVLMGIYHVRIPYPTTDKESIEEATAKEEKKEFESDAIFEEVPTE